MCFVTIRQGHLLGRASVIAVGKVPVVLRLARSHKFHRRSRRRGMLKIRMARRSPDREWTSSFEETLRVGELVPVHRCRS
jgi:hypothetical protein